MTEIEIYNYLKEKEIYAEVSSDKLHGITVISVEIEWGDWKHDHLYCEYLMKQKGYVEIGDRVTEEDGSDCYSAIHYYISSEDKEALA